MRTAKLGFSQLRDSELLNLAGTVLAAMRDNTRFATPVPPLTDLETALDDFRTLLEVASRKGSPLDTALKNDAREALAEVLKRLAFYVNTVAEGSVSVVLSSGFQLTAQPTKSLPPAIPTRLKLRDWIQSGQVRLDFDTMPGAWLYEYAFTSELDEQGRPVFGDVLSTTRSIGNVLAPLRPGATYYVRARSRNGAGFSDWSDPVSIIAR